MKIDRLKIFRIAKYAFGGIGILLAAFILWQITLVPPTEGNWQQQLAVPAVATFDGDIVTVKNVRNFRYSPTEEDMLPAYYDRAYDLSKIKKVWYVVEPFNEARYAGHTFLSFEFTNGDFLALSIEARKVVGQKYSVWKGLLRTYPLMYVASDERDLIPLRANIRKDEIFVYPVKFSSPENARALLTDMLRTMNDLTGARPEWYNTLFNNCTSRIADHVNKISPGRISKFAWQLVFTASADELALKSGLLDTDLSLSEARKEFRINSYSQSIGDVPEYSTFIRKETPIPREDEKAYFCTQEAMECPDGTYVSRTGPRCEFSPCPGEYPPLEPTE